MSAILLAHWICYVMVEKDWSIRPKSGIGPITINARRSLVAELLGTYTSRAPSSHEFGDGPEDFFRDGDVQVNYDSGNTVTMCSVWRGGQELFLAGQDVWRLRRDDILKIAIANNWRVSVLPFTDEFWWFLDEQIWVRWDEDEIKAAGSFREGLYLRSRFIDRKHLHAR